MTRDNVAEAYDYLMSDIFPGIIQYDQTLIKEVEAFGGDLQFIDRTLVFTIPVLFEFASELFARNSGCHIESSRKNYLYFRKLLYGNPTNSRLRQLGGYVEIETANQEHDFSIYKMRVI